MTGTIKTNVEVWDTMEDGTEIATHYPVKVSFYFERGTFEQPAESTIDVVDYYGIDPNGQLAKQINDAVHQLPWDDILPQLADDDY